jgi:hypothetical protein
MSVAREAFLLPSVFLTVAWLGGFRMDETVRLVPPPLIALALAMLLLGCLARAGVLQPERLMNSGRTALENLSGLVVLLSLFAACAQVFNLVTPETGLLHLLFSLFFLVQLLTTLAAVRTRVLMLRGLAVLLGSAFLIRFVALEALYSTDGGTLQRVLTVLMEGVTLGALEYSPTAPLTGYVAFLVLALFMTGLILLGHDGKTGELPELPASSTPPGLPESSKVRQLR